MRTDSMLWLGVNPGLGGGAALVGPGRELLGYWPCPTVRVGDGDRRAYDRDGLRLVARRAAERGARVVLERQQPLPGGGAVSGWSLACGYMGWLMALEGEGLPLHEVPPPTWKRALNLVAPGETRPRRPLAAPELVAAWKAQRPGQEQGKRALARWRRARPKPEAAADAAWALEDKLARASRRKAGLHLMCARALELFPRVDLRATGRSKVPDHNRAAALLLAVYGQEHLEVRGG